MSCVLWPCCLKKGKIFHYFSHIGHIHTHFWLEKSYEGLRTITWSLCLCASVMFWSETGDEAKIETAGMDGSNRRVLVRRSLHTPVGLALDLLQNRLYWVDEKLRCIGSATLDGEDVKVNFIRLLVR